MDDLEHYIRIRFGLAPNEPTPDQFSTILNSITAFMQSNHREPTVDELRELVASVCPSTGRWKYGADVNAELRRQLAALRAQAKR